MNRQDSLEMEKTITSMLEQVLNDESDEEIKASMRKDRRANTTKNQEYSHPKVSDLYGEKVTAPKLFINDQPYFQEPEPRNQFMFPPNSNLGGNFLGANFQNSLTPNFNLMRNERKFNTVIVNNNMQIPNLLNSNKPHPCFVNMNDFNSQSTNSSLQFNYVPGKKSVEENINSNLFSLNEFDEMLEKRVRPVEEIDSDTYLIFQGHFLKLITSQNGSRILQKALKKTNPNIISKIFDEVKEKISELMTDSYANYFCQKFFAFLSEEDRVVFLKKIDANIVEVSNSKIGTYPLQAIVDQIRREAEKKIMINSVKGKVILLCLDPQGTHVIEKMLSTFQEDEVKHIYTDVLDNLIMLANNANGLCVVKKVIIHGQHIETLNSIREKLAEKALDIVQNPFGNYALQVALENWSAEFCLPIIERFIGNFYELSMQKYSSNVIEKCFEKCDESIVSKFIEEVCLDTKVLDLMKNSYGNYVVQKALKLSSGNSKSQMVNFIKKNLDKLGDRKLINKWKTIIHNSTHLNLGMIETNFSGLNSSGSSTKSNHSANYNTLNLSFSPTQQILPNNRFSRSLAGSPQLRSNNMQMPHMIHPNFYFPNLNQY